MDKIIIRNLVLENCNKIINDEIPQGLTYIVGKNGSGKTTLLDYISGIKTDKNKSVITSSELIYVNQTDFFSPRLKVKDFLKFISGLSGKNISENSFKETYKDIFDRETLQRIFTQKWGTLSGGERKIIYILSLLMTEKEWYILDEPFANLDIEKKQMLLNVIDLKLRLKKNIIITSHDLNDILENKCNHYINLDVC